MRLAAFLCCALLSLVSPAHAGRLQWGVETWDFGAHVFSVQLGDGKDVSVTSITGTLALARQPGAARGTMRLREALVSIGPPGPAALPGKIIATPANTNQSISNNLIVLIAKQTGDSGPSHVPFHILFPEPVTVPNGLLTVWVDAQTWENGWQISGAPYQVEAPNVEMQFDVFWK